MTKLFDEITVTREGLRVDLMLARRDRGQIEGLVEASLALIPAAAEVGVELPVGMRVRLARGDDGATRTSIIRLWD